MAVSAAPAAASKATLRELFVAVAGYGLPGSVRTLPDEPLPAATWTRLVRRATGERLVGLLGEAVADGALPVTDEQLDELAEAHQAAMALSIEVERVAQRVLTVLARAEVTTRILKGIALAHCSYTRPEQRPTGDVDVLVPAAHLDRAVQALIDDGATRSWPQLRPGFDRRFAKAVTMTAADGVNVVDVHRTFVMGPFGLALDRDALFDGGQPFAVGNVAATALGREERLLHACYNAAVGERPPRTLALRDIAQLVLVDEADPDRTLELAAAWRARVLLAEALREAWDVLALADRTPLVSWAARYEPTVTERRWLAASRTDRYAPKAWASLPLLPGVRDKVAFVGALTLPRRGWMAAREQGRRGWLHGAWHALREFER